MALSISPWRRFTKSFLFMSQDPELLSINAEILKRCLCFTRPVSLTLCFTTTLHVLLYYIYLTALITLFLFHLQLIEILLYFVRFSSILSHNWSNICCCIRELTCSWQNDGKGSRLCCWRLLKVTWYQGYPAPPKQSRFLNQISASFLLHHTAAAAAATEKSTKAHKESHHTRSVSGAKCGNNICNVKSVSSFFRVFLFYFSDKQKYWQDSDFC